MIACAFIVLVTLPGCFVFANIRKNLYKGEVMEDIERIKCKWCLGRGTNQAEYGPVPCPDCYGTGRIEVLPEDGGEDGNS